tara:strand:- start:3844 stop:4887 length:1044 start_codon:yes stop_codon:yes gene_type:complete
MYDNKHPILITGAAGFVGAAVSKKFLLEDINVIGIDNLNNYYDKKLKIKRIENIKESILNSASKFDFQEQKIEDKLNLEDLFNKYRPKIVINLAAQAGVRYSLENPSSYIQSNLVGFANILEVCRKYNIQNLIYASSSSVYGGNSNLPYKEDQSVSHPVSLYAATKKSNELMAHTYSHLFGIPATALRLFTVYGPWGRPDMAPMIFANAILNNQPIDVFNYGNMFRDFTYIDDVAEIIFRCAFKPAQPNKNFDKTNPDPSTSFAPHRIFNVGNSNSIKLIDFIQCLEKELGKNTIKNFKDIQPGDVVSTLANSNAIYEWIGFKPSTSLNRGVTKFVKWYLEYFEINN